MRLILFIFLAVSSALQAQHVIIGRDTPQQNGEVITDTFFLYNQLLGALRGGSLYNSDYWSPENSGDLSFAYGINTLASGKASFSIGNSTRAKGNYATATGIDTEASGEYSFSTGYRNVASGEGSFVSGFNNNSTGSRSFVSGITNIASGTSSFAAGSGVYARSICEMSIGRYGTDYEPQGSGITWNINDRLFVVGNGSGPGSNRSNAMVLLKSGDVMFPDGSLLVGRDSMPKNGEIIEDHLMFYDNIKGAFRGGRSYSSENWSPDSIGISSFAFGSNLKAKAHNSVAFGTSTQSLSNAAFSCGSNTIAARGGSFAANYNASARGFASTAFGSFTTSMSNSEFVLGIYNTDYTPEGVFMPMSTDRLFVIGNGTAEDAKSDAMVVLKNGNTTINGDVKISDPTSHASLLMQPSGGVEGRMLVYQSNGHFFLGDIDDVGENLYLKVGGDERITVLNNGNVGIGNNNPEEKLHVQGNICYTGSIAACSDLRYKTQFSPIASPLSKINQLNGLYYYWNKDLFPEKDFSSKRQIGVIAQEVEALFPEMVLTDSEGYKSVDYSRLTPVLLEAVKELNQQNEELTSRMDKLEKQLGLLLESSN